MNFYGRRPMGFSGAISLISGLELMFMGLTWSNSGLLSGPGFLVSPVGKEGRRRKKGEGKEGKGNRKGMEGRKKE